MGKITENTIKGIKSELAVKRKILDIGWIPSVPIIPAKYDILVDTGTDIFKCQIKKARDRADQDKESIEATFHRGRYTKDGAMNQVHYEESDIDSYIIHYPSREIFYWVWFQEAGDYKFGGQPSNIELYKIDNRVKNIEKGDKNIIEKKGRSIANKADSLPDDSGLKSVVENNK